ncbi:MAG TPA: nucleotidyltransferase domain-containing protein [Rectinemataceae bacterium]|nr:nucleotidyltransferase domain-containing protein [Rectinemataceae bacterium]
MHTNLVVLFGSRARRTASPASDIDIGVLEKARAELDPRIDADNFGRPVHA